MPVIQPDSTSPDLLKNGIQEVQIIANVFFKDTNVDPSDS